MAFLFLLWCLQTATHEKVFLMAQDNLDAVFPSRLFVVVWGAMDMAFAVVDVAGMCIYSYVYIYIGSVDGVGRYKYLLLLLHAVKSKAFGID